MTWWFRLWQRSKLERDLGRELQFHVAERISALRNSGLSEEEARRQVRQEFGGIEQVKEECRDARGTMWLESTMQDLRYSLRTLRKSPVFTVVAVLTLGLGIGANTAIFSLINAAMLRLLPVQHPEQLVLLTDPSQSGVAADTTEHGIRSILSYPEFEDLRSGNTVFSGMLAAESEVNESDIFPGDNTAGQAVKARTELVSGDFFFVLGVEPIMGRVFSSEEDKVPGANPVTVVSYGYWQHGLAGNPRVIGSTIRVGQGIFQIVGVAPLGFRGILVGSDTDFWFPLTMQAQVRPGRDYLKPRDTLWLQVMARLAPGISRQTAEAGINTTFQQTLRERAGTLPTQRQRQEMRNEKIKLRPGSRGASELRGQFSDPLILLMAMVGVVLLIACANIANLMLARANGRQREIGVRLALGAARRRLIRQLVTESLLVAFLGGVLGICLSVVGTRLLLALVSTGIDDLGLDVPLDYHVLVFTAVISVVTGLAFGLVPAYRGTRLDINRTLAANARTSIGGHGRVRTGRILVVVQVALSLVLLMGGALFVRSLKNLLTQNLGYDRNHLLMVSVDPAAAGYKAQAMPVMYERLRAELRTIPAVRSVTVSAEDLFTGDSGDHLAIEGSPVRDAEQLKSRWTEIGADYFKTLKIPLLRGREIDLSDAARAAPVCVINESFLRRFFPDLDPIGKHITDQYPTTRETFQIIGVVADSKEHSLDEKPEPRFYANISHPIGTVGGLSFLLSTSAEPGSIGSEVRKVLRQFDANLPILSIRTVNQQIERRLVTQRLVANLAAFFAGLALLMAAIGLYGVMSYSMSRRTNEIGIRMALGASATGVMRMVLGEALWVVLIGMAIGLPCSVAAARLISSRLYGVTAADPASIATAIFIVLTSALLAGYVPAHRASRIDPIASLRHE
jgi:predicted permease